MQYTAETHKIKSSERSQTQENALSDSVSAKLEKEQNIICGGGNRERLSWLCQERVMPGGRFPGEEAGFPTCLPSC